MWSAVSLGHGGELVEGLAPNHHLATRVDFEFQQYGIHVQLGIETGRHCPDSLSHPDLAFGHDPRVIGHVLGLEGDNVDVLACGLSDQCAHQLAPTRRGRAPHDHEWT